MVPIQSAHPYKPPCPPGSANRRRTTSAAAYKPAQRREEKHEWPGASQLTLAFDPVSLDGPDGTLVWNEGTLNVKAHDRRLEGELFLDLEQADIRGVSVRAANVSAILDTPGTGGGETQLVWQAAAAMHVQKVARGRLARQLLGQHLVRGRPFELRRRRSSFGEDTELSQMSRAPPVMVALLV